MWATGARISEVEQARHWGQEKMGPRREELAESNRRVGLTRESWHLQFTSNGVLMTLSCEGDDLARMFAAYAAADGPFERWEKEQIKALTGVDLGSATCRRAPRDVGRLAASLRRLGDRLDEDERDAPVSADAA